jgi:Fe-S-cluster containining protein
MSFRLFRTEGLRFRATCRYRGLLPAPHFSSSSLCPRFQGMLQSVSKHKCDRCGACCKGHLVVEAYEIDVLREPRLISADPHYADKSLEEALSELQDEFKCVLVAGGQACMFLDRSNRCSIYRTRPNDCVAMQAGDEQCQKSREAERLEPLGPVDS